MRHITISTTGIFNAIRPSLFPPIEGKETTTFLLGLDFHAGEISPFYDEEQDDVVANGPYIELEQQRIRAYVKAVCEEMGKPFEERRIASKGASVKAVFGCSCSLCGPRAGLVS